MRHEHTASPSARTVLVAGDDSSERSLLVALLARDTGLVLLQAADAEATRTMLLARTPRIDALLLDGRLDGHDGALLCENLRCSRVVVPILVVGSDSEAAVVRSLNAGANDYLSRPLRPAELAARLRAQLRTHEVSDDAVLLIGPFQFRPTLRQLLDSNTGQRILLTEKETAVLKCLYRAEGKVVPRVVLLHEVWGYSPTASTHTVETHVYRLRQKIGPHAAQQRLLLSDARGYRLDPNWDRPGPPTR